MSKKQPAPIATTRTLAPHAESTMAVRQFAQLRNVPWAVPLVADTDRRTLQQWDLWLDSLRTRTAQ